MNLLTRILVPVVVLALAVTALVAFVFGGGHQKTLTADFPRTVSLYEGSDVRVLGVPVGKVDSVTPSGTQVVVTMHYDADVHLPANAKAVIISPSIVGDRFVQLTPAYSGGQTLADGATLDQDHTAVPLELDQIYSSLDDLTVALGPNGANQKGALTDLLDTTASELRRAGQEVPPDDRELREAQRHPRRQQGPAVRVGAAARGVRPDPRPQRPHRPHVQPHAGAGLRHVEGRAR